MDKKRSISCRPACSRRAALRSAACGFGSLALAGLAHHSTIARTPHFAPKAKRVIFLYMAGGPSHLETFDYKPTLEKLDGTPMPESFTKGEEIAQLQGQELKCMRPLFTFDKYGQSGQEISSVLPHTQKIADDICIVRSMVTDQINHDPAHTVMNSGSPISGRPSMGAWLLYGLGNECENLPGFIVLTSKGGRNPQPISTRQWHSGFLPSKFQGVYFQSTGDPVHYVSNPPGVNGDRQRDVVEAVQALNGIHHDAIEDDEVATRIAQYEMAFRMQTSVPDLVDISDEPQHILDSYGVEGADGSFGFNCLLARRLAERGVRFIQLYHRGWDHHNDLERYMNICAGHCDQATAALVSDLKQRGMLEDTLIVWGGEFGRTPMVQENKGAPGRDHHKNAFSIWMAGGGIKPGMTYGATDELGYNSVENVVTVHDFHATMLHQLGIDHLKLTHRFQGRDFRLTDVSGKVVYDIIT